MVTIIAKTTNPNTGRPVVVLDNGNYYSNDSGIGKSTVKDNAIYLWSNDECDNVPCELTNIQPIEVDSVAEVKLLINNI